MTFFMLLLVSLVLGELVAGFRLLRQDRPTAPPPSHPDWSQDGLPSTPYASRR